MTREEAQALVDALVTMRENATDAQASNAAAMYPTLKANGALIKTGTRINWHGTIKRAANDLWDSVENDPDHAPDLWDDIEYRDGYRVLTGPISATNPVQPGECCWEQDVLYRNILGVASTYLPSEYPTGWEVIK